MMLDMSRDDIQVLDGLSAPHLPDESVTSWDTASSSMSLPSTVILATSDDSGEKREVGDFEEDLEEEDMEIPSSQSHLAHNTVQRPSYLSLSDSTMPTKKKFKASKFVSIQPTVS